MPKVLAIAGVSILALGLVLGLTLPGLAAPDEPLPWTEDFQIKIVKGEVLSVDEVNQEYFKIQCGEEERTISVDGDTQYFKLCVPERIVSLARHWMQFRHQNQEEIGAPGWGGMGLGLQNQVRARALARHQMRLQNEVYPPDNGDIPKPTGLNWLCPFGEEAQFSDIEVGDRVVVWLADEDNLAERVLIIKLTTYASVSGAIVVDLDEGTITITPDDSEAVTLSYNEGTVFILRGVIEVEQWQYAHATYDSDNMIAKRVVVHQEAP